MFNGSKRKVKSFVKKHPVKSAAVATAAVKAAKSRTAQIIAASAAAGTIGYLVYRKVHHGNGHLHTARSRVGEGAQGLKSLFHGKMSHFR